jgi:hypothetical protein
MEGTLPLTEKAACATYKTKQQENQENHATTGNTANLTMFHVCI